MSSMLRMSAIVLLASTVLSASGPVAAEDAAAQWDKARQGLVATDASPMGCAIDRWEELTKIVTSAIRERGGLTVSEIRTLLDSSRKYIVPLAEYLDAVGVTRRVGDQRVLGPNAATD